MITENNVLPRGLRSISNWASTGRWLAALLAMSCLPVGSVKSQFQAVIVVDFVDETTGDPIPTRIELKDAKGRPQKVKGAVNRPPYTLLEGPLDFKARTGSYRFDVYHGPQYAKGAGGFELKKDGDGTDTVHLPRHADVEKEGWFAGDLLNYVPADETALWLPAEDLKMAAVLMRSRPVAAADSNTGSEGAAEPKDKRTATADKPDEQDDSQGDDASPANATASTLTTELPKDAKNVVKLERRSLKRSRWLDVGGYVDDRIGSGLILHGWLPPKAVPSWVPPSRLLEMAKKEPHVHAELSGLWQNETPLLLAGGMIDTVQLFSDHVVREGKSEYPISKMFNPDPKLFSGPKGPGRLSEHLYWQMLEAGLRIAPSAGSGFGRSSNPLGYNRVYVMCEPNKCTPESWWENLRSGRSFVTNGPLLRPTVNGQPPGHVFQLGEGEKFAIKVGLVLTVAEPVDYVDVVFNGEAIYHARLDEHAKRGGQIPSLEITESGWLVVRVVTQREESYRMATSAPYYFECAEKSRISRAAVEMFQGWLEQTDKDLAASDPQRHQATSPYIESARRFWKERADAATAP